MQTALSFQNQSFVILLFWFIFPLIAQSSGCPYQNRKVIIKSLLQASQGVHLASHDFNFIATWFSQVPCDYITPTKLIKQEFSVWYRVYIIFCVNRQTTFRVWHVEKGENTSLSTNERVSNLALCFRALILQSSISRFFVIFNLFRSHLFK